MLGSLRVSGSSKKIELRCWLLSGEFRSVSCDFRNVLLAGIGFPVRSRFDEVRVEVAPERGSSILNDSVESPILIRA